MTVRIISWFAQSIRCVLITPLGRPVEPDVKSTFATVSGPTRACAVVDSSGRARRLERGERRGSQSCRAGCRSRPRRQPATLRQGALEQRALGREHEPRPQRLPQHAQRACSRVASSE